MSKRPSFNNIDGYIASVPSKVAPILQEIRERVKAAVPGAEETISYQIPALRANGVFFYFAAFKKHVGVFPPLAKGSDALEKALLPYRGEKGNLRFPLNKPMPYALIVRVARALAREHAQRATAKERSKGATPRTRQPDPPPAINS